MKKIVLFGELMLRLKPEGKDRFFQKPCFEAVFGGSEANVAVSLACLGKKSVFATGFPDNAIGNAAESSLRSFGVEVKSLKKDGRLGIYFLESGACQRPSNVIYDRDGSVFSLAGPDEYNWKEIFEDAEWFHLSGVTPAVSENSFRSSVRAMDEAKKAGCRISLDLNYRKRLWKWGKSAQDAMKVLSEKADVLIANEEDIQNCLGIPLKNHLENNLSPNESYRVLCEDVKKRFPNAQYVAVTLRQSFSADRNGWSAVLSGKHGFYESAHYDIENIVERVGAGDSFAAGLIFAFTEFASSGFGLSREDEVKSLDFAVAASCLKHSISGDFNLSSKDEVLSLMKGNTNGRIQR